MLQILLPASPAASYYLLFYLLGFGVAGALLLWEGYRRSYCWRRWLPLLAGTLLCLILGTRLVAGSRLDWQHLLTHAEWNGPDTRSILGGLLGAGLALAGLRRALGFGRDAYDAVAKPFLVGLAVQGLGCLLTGCCFGTVTESGAGIRYAPSTLPYLVQVARGILPPTAAHSLAVHPAQLYQIGLCLLIAGLFCWPTFRRQVAGQQFIQAMLLYVAGRFALEFLRDTSGDVLGSAHWLGLKQIQWHLLLTMAFLLAVTVYRGYRPSVAQVSVYSSGPWPARVVLGLLLVITALLSAHWLALPEQLVVKTLLLGSIVTEAAVWLRAHAGPSPRLVGLPLLLSATVLLLTSQAPAPDERRYTTVSAGGLAGVSQQYFNYPYGCSGTQGPAYTYQQRFQAGSIGIARTLPIRRAGTITLGVDWNMGRSNFRPQQDSIYLNSSPSAPNLSPFERGHARLYSINPYLEISNPRYLRLGLGAHLGDVAYDFVYRPGKLSRVRLQFLLEAGRMNTLYFHGSINHRLQGLGNGFSTIGLGSGFGQERLRLVGGVALANSEFNVGLFDRTSGRPMPFLQAQVPLGQSWTLEPFVASNFGTVREFRLRTSYRLPRRAPAVGQ